MENLSGQTIKGYELKERLGAGSFGAVYKAHQSTIRRDVAIKVILPHFTHHPDFVRRFEAEAQIIARLEHPYIAPLYDYNLHTSMKGAIRRWNIKKTYNFFKSFSSALKLTISVFSLVKYDCTPKLN